MMTHKKYLRIKNNLLFIFSDIADILDVSFNEIAFKDIDAKDIDYCVNYLSRNSDTMLTTIEYLNSTYFLILGASTTKVLNCCQQTDKFKAYKF